MSFTKAVLVASIAALVPASASALTIANQDKAELKIGIDEGNVEHVKTVAAGKSGDLSAVCKQGCGLTGPWGFSWMAQPGDELVYNNARLNGATVIAETSTQ